MLQKDNPELFERLIVEEMISLKRAKAKEDPEKIFARWEVRGDAHKIATDAEAAYYGDLIDHTYDTIRDRKTARK